MVVLLSSLINLSLLVGIIYLVVKFFIRRKELKQIEINPKTRSIGVTIFGWLLIIGSVIWVARFWNWFNTGITEERILLVIENMVNLIAVILLFFIGINILRLKEIGRKLAIYVALCSFNVTSAILILSLIMDTPVYTIPVLPELAYRLFIIYFFTRPKVKEQFK